MRDFFFFHLSSNYCPALLQKWRQISQVSNAVVGASKFNEPDSFVVQVHYLNELTWNYVKFSGERSIIVPLFFLNH